MYALHFLRAHQNFNLVINVQKTQIQLLPSDTGTGRMI